MIKNINKSETFLISIVFHKHFNTNQTQNILLLINDKFQLSIHLFKEFNKSFYILQIIIAIYALCYHFQKKNKKHILLFTDQKNKFLYDGQYQVQDVDIDCS